MQPQQNLSTFSPLIYNPKDYSFPLNLKKILSQMPYVLDKIDMQLCELVKLRSADRNLSKSEIDSLVQQHLAGIAREDYGVWIYYPWRNTLLHILDELEFIEVRTARNKYKITPAEQYKLKNKKVGVIGLSVGHSVAMALAIERICGEIRIADLDRMELTNMNRIRTGLHNLGELKSVVVAREIAELDPFIKIVPFHEGITEDNISSFFSENGTLDLLVEECDSVEIKILSRELARQYKVPIIMDTSDRGMIDIERYDLIPNLPILHGLVSENLSVEFLKSLETSKQKLPYILPFAGVNEVSNRMACSALEIEATINSWPQLGSDVQIGGGIAANISRQILLGAEIVSQRHYFEKWNLQEETNKKEYSLEFNSDSDLQREIVIPYLIKDADEIVEVDEIQLIIERSLRAPSASNLQPWEMTFAGNCLLIYSSEDNSKNPSNNNSISSCLAIGSLLQNIIIIAEAKAYSVAIDYIIETSIPIIVRLLFTKVKEANLGDGLVDFIDARRTNREIGDHSKLTTYELSELMKLLEGCPVVEGNLICDQSVISELGRIICACDKIRFLNKSTHTEFFSGELKKGENRIHNDGLVQSHLLLDEMDEIGLTLLERSEVREFLERNNLGTSLYNLSTESVRAASAFMVCCIDMYDVKTLVDAGKFIQNFWLKCTQLNIGLHPMTAAIPLISLISSDQYGYLNEFEKEDLNTLHQDLVKLLGLMKKKPIFICRLHKAKCEGHYSKRISIKKKLQIL